MKPFLPVVLLLFSVHSFAQRVQTVTGTFVYPVPTDESLEVAKAKALDLAKIHILADTFGTGVSSTGVSHIDATGGDSYVQVSEVSVQGEWIQTVGAPEYSFSEKNGLVVLTVTVTGRVREIRRAVTDLKTSVFRNGLTERFSADEFVDGDKIYLSFQSPVKGYLVVYLTDGTNAWQMLPYPHQDTGNIPVKAGKEYIFFSPEIVQDGIDPSLVHEFEMTCEGNLEVDRLHVIFSPNPFNKPVGRRVSSSLPEMLSERVFLRWLARARRQDSEMTVQEKVLTIRKRD